MRLLYVAAMSRSIQGAAWVAALAALWAYALTLSPTVAWVNLGEDSGDLLAASATLGIPHPTGYPLFVLLGRLATFLPLGTIAFRINLVAAVAAAASVYFVVGLAGAVLLPVLIFWGLTLDLYLPVRAARNPEFSWGAPTSPGQLWWVLSGAQYARNFFVRDFTGAVRHLVPGRWAMDFGWGLLI